MEHNHIERLTALLVWLRSKRWVRAQDMADHFGVSLRTIYRDIRVLERAGVPIGSEAGKGYFMVEGYHLPPVMFTQSEAGALLVALKLVEEFGDESLSRHLVDAMTKIRSVLRTTDRDYLESVERNIMVINPTKMEQIQGFGHWLSRLQDALAARKVVRLIYHGSGRGEETRRDVEPVGLMYYSSGWHLIAWCRLRQDYRDFKINRMERVELLDEVFDPASHPSIQQYLDAITRSYALSEVLLKVRRADASWLQRAKFQHGWVGDTETEEFITMRFLVSSLDGISRWVLSVKDQVEIVSPEELKDRVRELANKLSHP